MIYICPAFAANTFMTDEPVNAKTPNRNVSECMTNFQIDIPSLVANKLQDTERSKTVHNSKLRD